MAIRSSGMCLRFISSQRRGELAEGVCEKEVEGRIATTERELHDGLRGLWQKRKRAHSKIVAVQRLPCKFEAATRFEKKSRCTRVSPHQLDDRKIAPTNNLLPGQLPQK